jgi:hypothetical protein
LNSNFKKNGDYCKKIDHMQAFGIWSYIDDKLHLPRQFN